MLASTFYTLFCIRCICFYPRQIIKAPCNLTCDDVFGYLYVTEFILAEHTWRTLHYFACFHWSLWHIAQTTVTVISSKLLVQPPHHLLTHANHDMPCSLSCSHKMIAVASDLDVAVDAEVKRLVPLWVVAVGHCLGAVRASRGRGEPQNHIAVRLRH